MNTQSMPDPNHPYGSAGGAVHEARGTRVGPAGPSRPRRKWGMAAGVIVAGFVLAGCQSGNDAPVVSGNEKGDQTPAEIIAMPDGFSNVATKCDAYGNRIYTIFHGGNYGSVAIVPQDKSCGPK